MGGSPGPLSSRGPGQSQWPAVPGRRAQAGPVPLCAPGMGSASSGPPRGVLGLARSPSPRTQEVAFQLAQNWIQTNFRVYSQTSAMYEKVSRPCAAPSGHSRALPGWETQVSWP